MKKIMLLIAIISIALSGTANAIGTDVSSNINGSVTWTKANSPYHLKQQIYVEPGATLTIEAGTVVANYVADQGSLAVCRGAKIYVNGTADEPVIMTSAEDVNTWTGSVCTHSGDANNSVSEITTLGDPKTGRWLERCNDWGNLTVMGQALISASDCLGVAKTYQDGAGAPIHTNTLVPDGLNKATMEGLTAKFPGDPNVLYGGDNDDDDSGSIHYLSLRYGGKVIGLANELNGMSMGGIGRSTDVDHVDIMNNVDDGFETWGGTVNYKYMSVWNIGDDMMDCDEGWRGKAQFGLLVQGYSVNAAQGSGVGDNIFEIDGAENSDAQPITTATIYNFTCIGQPIFGDQGMAMRDNAHVQFRNCIFMDIGEQVLKNDNSDGDCGQGYGRNGTLPWVDCFTTPYTYRSPINQGTWTTGAFNDPNVLYTVQTDGRLMEVSDSVFCRNFFSSAYTESIARNVFDGNGQSNHNVIADGNHLPIQALVRGPAVTKGGGTMLPVISINPCPANNAVTSYATAPADGFFTPAQYRGAFAPNSNWLQGWTAADAYGMVDTYMNDTPGNTDLNHDGKTDLLDFSDLANNWML